LDRIAVGVSHRHHQRRREREGRHADVKYLWILQKQPDGAWKIGRAIYNLDGSIDDEEGVSA
jgi:ketosteroid isomerase-like protein